MSEKVMDRQGRWRNKTVAFRVSPQEDEAIETAVRLSGLSKQDIILFEDYWKKTLLYRGIRKYTKR